MHILNGIRNGLREIIANKVRSFVTMLGVILGVAALVSMIAIVEGLFEGWNSWFRERGGLERIGIDDESVPASQRHLAFLSPGRSMTDVEALAELSFATAVGPEQNQNDMLVAYGEVNRRYWVSGVNAGSLLTMKHRVDRGREFTDFEINRNAQVALIGKGVTDFLYPPKRDPVGTEITIDGLPFTVIGELEQYGTGQWGREFSWKDYHILMPISTMQNRFHGHEQLSFLSVNLADPLQLPEAVDAIRNVLMFTHRGIADFEVETMEEAYEQLKSSQLGFQFGMGGVAFLTILIGGMGIMNVMLASFNERIRELGVRKAVGARGSDLFVEFLCEAMTISGIGGLVGLGASLGLVFLVDLALGDGMSPIIRLEAMALAVAFSVTVGILAGLYPAFRAARLDPIDALRHE